MRKVAMVPGADRESHEGVHAEEKGGHPQRETAVEGVPDQDRYSQYGCDGEKDNVDPILAAFAGSGVAQTMFSNADT